MPCTDQAAARGWQVGQRGGGTGNLRASSMEDSSLRTTWSDGLGGGRGPDWRSSGCVLERHGSLMPGDQQEVMAKCHPLSLRLPSSDNDSPVCHEGLGAPGGEGHSARGRRLGEGRGALGIPREDGALREGERGLGKQVGL